MGLITNERAVLSRWVELSSMERAEWRIGSCAAEPYRKTNEARMDLFQYSVCFFQNVFFDTNDLIIHVIYVHEYYKHYCSHLAADLCRDAGKLWVGGKCGQVFHSLDERSRGDSTSVPVLLREIPIQRLERERIHQNDPTSITLYSNHSILWYAN